MLGRPVAWATGPMGERGPCRPRRRMHARFDRAVAGRDRGLL